MDKQHWERFLEFVVIGVSLGVVEDVIAIKLATGEPITFTTVLVIVGVAIPFAAFSELVVDSEGSGVRQTFSNLAHRIEKAL